MVAIIISNYMGRATCTLHHTSITTRAQGPGHQLSESTVLSRKNICCGSVTKKISSISQKYLLPLNLQQHSSQDPGAGYQRANQRSLSSTEHNNTLAHLLTCTHHSHPRIYTIWVWREESVARELDHEVNTREHNSYVVGIDLIVHPRPQQHRRPAPPPHGTDQLTAARHGAMPPCAPRPTARVRATTHTNIFYIQIFFSIIWNFDLTRVKCKENICHSV